MPRAAHKQPSPAPFDARDDAGLDELYQAILLLRDVEDCQRFFVDLCTPAELHALRDRWRVVRLVSQGFPYREIHDLTGVSTATITRVGRTLNYGSGGYGVLLERSRRRAASKARKLADANGRKTSRVARNGQAAQPRSKSRTTSKAAQARSSADMTNEANATKKTKTTNTPRSTSTGRQPGTSKSRRQEKTP